MKMQLNPFGVRYKKPQVSTRKSLTHVRIRAQSKKIPITSQPELTAAHGNITLVATGLTLDHLHHAVGGRGLSGGHSVEANWKQKPFKSLKKNKKPTSVLSFH